MQHWFKGGVSVLNFGTYSKMAFNPSTPTSDQSQISSATWPEISHHTQWVWRTWLFIVYSDKRWLHDQSSLPHPIMHFSLGRLEVYFSNREQKGWSYKYGIYSTPDLSQRVDAVKDENLKLKSENQVIYHALVQWTFVRMETRGGNRHLPVEMEENPGFCCFEWQVTSFSSSYSSKKLNPLTHMGCAQAYLFMASPIVCLAHQVLGQYIENLMSASSVFQPTQTGTKERWVAVGLCWADWLHWICWRHKWLPVRVRMIQQDNQVCD